VPYNTWRTYDPENTLRFYGLRLHEVGMIQNHPENNCSGHRLAVPQRGQEGTQSLMIVVAKKPDDAKTLARIRGLGFAGLITEGAHHQPHHLAMAKGEALPGHTH
jgi:hypothetical protein